MPLLLENQLAPLFLAIKSYRVMDILDHNAFSAFQIISLDWEVKLLGQRV